MRRLLEQLYGRFPREFASPQRRRVNGMDEMAALIDEHNKRVDCFVTMYGFEADEPEELSYSDVVINKIVFDFDGEWHRLVDFHEWLGDRNIPHFVVFSGSNGSGHVYILTEPTKHQPSLEYTQRDVLIDGANLRKCDYCGGKVLRDDPSRVTPFYCEQCDERKTDKGTDPVVDMNVVGDASRCIRVPNTYNVDAERWCVPLRPGEIVRDTREVYDLARSQRPLALEDILCCPGGDPVDITQHKEAAEELYTGITENREMPAVRSDARVLEAHEAEVPPPEMFDSIRCECVRGLLEGHDGEGKPPLGHAQRRITISYLCEAGYNPREIAEFLKAYIAADKAHHSIHEEEQPMRVWRDQVKVPNKDRLKQRGMFVDGCPEHSATGQAGQAETGGDAA